MLEGETGLVTIVPPQLPLCHTIASPPPPTVAESVEASPLHIVAGFAAGPVGAEGNELTVTVTPVAQAALRQPVEVSLLCA